MSVNFYSSHGPADRIETKLLDAQEDCLRAYYGRDKRGHLLEANLQLEVARHLVRLAHGLGHQNASQVPKRSIARYSRLYSDKKDWFSIVSPAFPSTTTNPDHPLLAVPCSPIRSCRGLNPN